MSPPWEPGVPGARGGESRLALAHLLLGAAGLPHPPLHLQLVLQGLQLHLGGGRHHEAGLTGCCPPCPAEGLAGAGWGASPMNPGWAQCSRRLPLTQHPRDPQSGTLPGEERTEGTADLVPALLLLSPLLKLSPQGPAAGRAAVLQLLPHLLQLCALPAGPAGQCPASVGERNVGGAGRRGGGAGARGVGLGGGVTQRRTAPPVVPGRLLAQPLLLLGHLAVEPPP